MTPDDLAAIIVNELNLAYHGGKHNAAYVDADQGLDCVYIDGEVDLIALSTVILAVLNHPSE